MLTRGPKAAVTQGVGNWVVSEPKREGRAGAAAAGWASASWACGRIERREEVRECMARAAGPRRWAGAEGGDGPARRSGPKPRRGKWASTESRTGRRRGERKRVSFPFSIFSILFSKPISNVSQIEF